MVVAVERHGQESVEVILQVFLKGDGREREKIAPEPLAHETKHAFLEDLVSGCTCLLAACLVEPSGPPRGREGISVLPVSSRAGE